MQQAIDIAALPQLEGGATVVILRSKWYADIVGVAAREVRRGP